MKYLQVKFLDSETELYKGMGKRAIDLEMTMTDYVKGLLRNDLGMKQAEPEEKKITGKFEPDKRYSRAEIAGIIGVDKSQLSPGRRFGKQFEANNIKPDPDGKFYGSDLIKIFEDNK